MRIFVKAALVSMLIIAAGCTRLAPGSTEAWVESAIRTVLPYAVDVAMRCFPNDDTSTVSDEVIVVDGDGGPGDRARRAEPVRPELHRTLVRDVRRVQQDGESASLVTCTKDTHRTLVHAAASIVVVAERTRTTVEEAPIILAVERVEKRSAMRS